MASSSGYLNHFDSKTYDDKYFIYGDEFDRFDAIYDNFIATHDYIKLSNFDKMKRLFFKTVGQTDKILGGECYELSTSLVSKLTFYKIPARVVIGRNIAHTWVEFFIDNKWMAVDPADDINRYKNNQIWGVFRDYEYKVLMYI
jgi:hypothetical protein